MTPRDNRIFQFHWRKQKCLSLVRPNPHWIGLFTKFLFWCLSFTSDIYSIYPIPFTKGIFITYQDSWLFQKQLSTTKRCRLFANQSVMLIFEKKLIFFTIIVNAHDCMFFFCLFSCHICGQIWMGVAWPYIILWWNARLMPQHETDIIIIGIGYKFTKLDTKK